MGNSIFSGPISLRQQYADMPYTIINNSTSQSNAVLLCTLQNAFSLCFIYNSLDQPVTIWLLNPEVAVQDQQTVPDYTQLTNPANRIMWQEVPANYNLNQDPSGNPFYFSPGTRIYLSLAPNGQTINNVPTGTTTPATMGKFRILLG